MGIDTGCMLIVGLAADDLVDGLPEETRERIESEGFYDIVSEDGEMGLCRASPYYDAPYGHCVWGVSIAAGYWSAIELDEASLDDKVAAAKKVFKEKTGLDGRLYISPHVT